MTQFDSYCLFWVTRSADRWLDPPGRHFRYNSRSNRVPFCWVKVNYRNKANWVAAFSSWWEYCALHIFWHPRRTSDRHESRYTHRKPQEETYEFRILSPPVSLVLTWSDELSVGPLPLFLTEPKPPPRPQGRTYYHLSPALLLSVALGPYQVTWCPAPKNICEFPLISTFIIFFNWISIPL